MKFFGFFIVAFSAFFSFVQAQEVPDLASFAARFVDGNSQSITIKKGSKTVFKLVKEDNLFWKQEEAGSYIDTAYWMGFPPAGLELIETARWEARSFVPGTHTAKQEFSLFRALVGPNGDKRSQTLVFDNSGRVLRAFWTPSINESAALNGSEAVPIITDPELSLFAAAKQDSSIGVSRYSYSDKTKMLSRFVNEARGYLWDFKYDRKGRLYMISGKEGEKRVYYRFYYR